MVFFYVFFQIEGRGNAYYYSAFFLSPQHSFMGHTGTGTGNKYMFTLGYALTQTTQIFLVSSDIAPPAEPITPIVIWGKGGISLVGFIITLASLL